MFDRAVSDVPAVVELPMYSLNDGFTASTTELAATVAACAVAVKPARNIIAATDNLRETTMHGRCPTIRQWDWRFASHKAHSRGW